VLAIRYVVPPELVPELEQVLTREIGNDDVRGMEVRSVLEEAGERLLVPGRRLPKTA
jgi:hypothetical protein